MTRITRRRQLRRRKARKVGWRSASLGGRRSMTTDEGRGPLGRRQLRLADEPSIYVLPVGRNAATISPLPVTRRRNPQSALRVCLAKWNARLGFLLLPPCCISTCRQQFLETAHRVSSSRYHTTAGVLYCTFGLAFEIDRDGQRLSGNSQGAHAGRFLRSCLDVACR